MWTLLNGKLTRNLGKFHKNEQRYSEFWEVYDDKYISVSSFVFAVKIFYFAIKANQYARFLVLLHAVKS